MNNKALVIQDNQSQFFNCNDFMNVRNLTAEFCHSGPCALSAFQTKRYKCVLVSMDLQYENPLSIIRELRATEATHGLRPTQILVISSSRQPTKTDIDKLQINGQIRPHHMK
jgi:PleD family two-component response regulator